MNYVTSNKNGDRLVEETALEPNVHWFE